MGKKELISIKTDEIVHRGKFFGEDVYKNISLFTHYTSIPSANLIFAKECFKVSNIAGCNDLNEAELHSIDSDKTYILCFCATPKEQIPLWYLYGGIGGNGIRLELSKTNIIKLVEAIDEVYVLDGENNRLSYKRNIDYVVEIGLVTYIDANEETKISGKRYKIIDYSIDKIRQSFFIKDYEWNYEKEFRIVFKFKEKVGDSIFVPIDISLFNYCFAPEISSEEKENCLKKTGFIKHTFSKLKQSKLKIKMNLASRNIKSFVDYTGSEFFWQNSEAAEMAETIIKNLNQKTNGR